MKHRWQQYWHTLSSIAPLVTFRIIFGVVMLFSTLRYVYMGWVETQLVAPEIHFSYFGFGWVEPLPLWGMYAVFGILGLTSLGIALGWQYRLSVIAFFLCFTYVELIDISFYLNHYYFVSLVAFLMIWLPAHRSFSIDATRRPSLHSTEIPRWCIDILKCQIAIVYIYAGLAKINPDWLLEALPLAIWLPAKSYLPLVGPLLEHKWVAYVFSWAGMLFDTFIIFFLIARCTRIWAYGVVVVFHTMTGILFQIGIFPLVMIGVVTIFFDPSWHQAFHRFLREASAKYLFGIWTKVPSSAPSWSVSKEASAKYNGSAHPMTILPQGIVSQGEATDKSIWTKVSKTHKPPAFMIVAICLFISFQILFPWRYLLYDGNVFWTEEGYRFSWRVMLMEKAGTATFYVRDGVTHREGVVINHQLLTPHQEKQMSMQPDMILQYAHFLKDHYAARGMNDPSVRAEVFVTLNGRPSQLLIDPELDLTALRDSWHRKKWILPAPSRN